MLDGPLIARHAMRPVQWPVRESHFAISYTKEHCPDFLFCLFIPERRSVFFDRSSCRIYA